MSEQQNTRPAALVTGGGRGIGRAICLALAKAGFDLCINYAAGSSAAEQTAEECRGLGVQAVVLQADVTNPAECQNLVEKAAGTFGRLDVLVNNAGVNADKLILRMQEANRK